MQLSKDGKTDYEIVKPANPSEVDEYAIREFTLYLKQSTGVDFPVVAPEGMIEGKPSILVNKSASQFKKL